MYLAKGKNGKLGRQIPGVGLGARVEQAPMADYQGDVYVSPRSVEADQNYYSQKANEERAFRDAQRIANIAKRKAEAAKEAAKAKTIGAMQRMAKLDPNEAAIRKHFGRKMTMGDGDQAVSDSLQASPAVGVPSDQVVANPADWSNMDANMTLYTSGYDERPIEWRADFRQEMFTGNPLTRDGKYGPVTDFDRFVRGIDVNQSDIVNIAGGTMMGVHEDYPIVDKVASNHMGMLRALPKRLPKLPPKLSRGQVRALNKRFGFGDVWDDISDFASDTYDNAVDDLSSQLPADLSKQLSSALTGGGKVTSTSGGVVTVAQPVATSASSLGIPTWALYGGLGLLGFGFLLVMVKAVKS